MPLSELQYLALVTMEKMTIYVFLQGVFIVTSSIICIMCIYRISDVVIVYLYKSYVYKTGIYKISFSLGIQQNLHCTQNINDDSIPLTDKVN